MRRELVGTNRPSSPASVTDHPVSRRRPQSAYQTALRLLARRELSAAQLRDRLTRSALPTPEIEAAIVRLTREHAVDDIRTALAYARRAAEVKLRGQNRTRREVEALGIDPAIARRAVAAVFDEVDEDKVLERAIAKRLDGPIHDPAQFRRLHQALLRQGFSPDRVTAVLLSRTGRDTAFVEE